MAKKAACKCKPTECEECPEWIFTFADLVMLMMGFFVILWVLQPPPAKPGEQRQALPLNLLAAIREAFGHVPDPSSTDPVDVEMLIQKLNQMKPHRGPGLGGETTVPRKAPEGTDPEAELIRPSKQVGTGGKVLFAPADAKLSAESMRALDEIVPIIKGYRNIIMVKGHASADDYPDGTADSLKMDLSVKRAQAAADYLVSKGVDRETLRVQGCSTYEPVAQRAYTPEMKSLNRRVEVEATGALVKEYQDTKQGKAKEGTKETHAGGGE